MANCIVIFFAIVDIGLCFLISVCYFATSYTAYDKSYSSKINKAIIRAIIDFRHLNSYLMAVEDYHRIVIRIYVDKEAVTSFCMNIKHSYIH